MRFSGISTASSTSPPEPLILTDPERQLALSYAPRQPRAALACLWAVDERLGTIVAHAREPTIGAMRLLWWRDALAGLDGADAWNVDEPLLGQVAELLLPAGLAGHRLATIEEGWAVLLDIEDRNEASILTHGLQRGAPLFLMSAELLGAMADDIEAAGEGWALADLGHRMRDPAVRVAARRLAAARLASVNLSRWARALRPLGLLVTLARIDAAMPAGTLRRQGAPKRLLRALAYRLTGR